MLLLFTGSFVRAIGWTLVHSLWEGIAVALLAAILLLCTKRSSPALRYNILSVFGLFFLIAVGITFYLQYHVAATGTFQSVHTVIPDTGSVVFSAFHSASIIANDTKDGWIYRFDMIIQWFVLAWLLLFLFKCIRLVVGYYHTRRLRSAGYRPVPFNWQQSAGRLACEIGIRRKISFIESASIKVPVVLGFLKPVILFPLGLLSNLPPEQAEAILLHELAHIRRYDYLINLFQCLTETVFFFNPAIIWISFLMRRERENCCDAIVVDHTSSRETYIRALVSFQEYNLARPRYAMALYDNSPRLLQRVQRIVYNHNRTLTAMEKTFLSIALVAGIAFAVNYYPAISPRKNNKPTVISARQRGPAPQLRKDTLPALNMQNGTILTTYEGKQYKIILKAGKVTDLYIDSRQVPADKVNDYKITTDAIIASVSNRDEEARQEELKARAATDANRRKIELNLQREERLQREAEEKYRQTDKMKQESEEQELKLKQDLISQDQQLKELNETRLKELNEFRLKQDKQRQELELDKRLSPLPGLRNGQLRQEGDLRNKLITESAINREKLQLDREQSKEYRQKANEERKSNQENLKLAQKINKEIQKSRIQSGDERRKEEGIRAREEGMKAREEGVRTLQEGTKDQIIRDLLEDHLISNTTDFSFTLDMSGLIVNGLRQPDNIFKKYCDKYVKGKGWRINYSNQSKRSASYQLI